jgi:DNA-binding HxlR family transcriptional regulator
VGIEVLQEKWVLHIVHALLDGPMGFNAISREVGGCNPTTLTQRLARLESLGLIEKLDGSEASAPLGNGRSCYCLTESGRSLETVIDAIRSWAVGNLSAARPS